MYLNVYIYDRYSCRKMYGPNAKYSAHN